MGINAIGNGPVNHGQAIKAAKQQGDQIKPPKTDPTPQTEPQRAKGVVRLLQEGHFNGVADVRLRINFADELNAISHASLRSAAGADVSALLDAVDTEVAAFLASGEHDDALVEGVQNAQAAFVSSVKDLVAGFGDESNPQAADLLSGIQAAFDTFVSTLTQNFTPEETAESASIPDGNEANAASELNAVDILSLPEEFQSFIDKLTAAFDAAIADFENQLTQVLQSLPPLSAPNGNGGAYEKFLAILNGLNGTLDESSAPPPSDLDSSV